MVEGERTFLGLTHNPFVEPQRGFFDRGGRKSHLEQLRHLSQWSRRVLLVTGPHGVGKSTLYRELMATLEPRVKAARISAGLVNAGREVLAAIAQGLGVPASANANVQSLHGDIAHHVEAQAAGDRPCLVVVDDAQLLDNKAIDELIALVHETALHLILFGEVRMVPVIERAASSKGVGWQEIRLSPYGEADARDYLEWRFQQAKYRGRVPFTDQQVRELFRLSGGLPGKLNQMANVLLVKLETGEASVARATFPRLHGALLALLVVLVALLYLLFEQAPPDLETVALDVPAIAAENTPGDEAVAAPDLQTQTRSPEPPPEAVAAEDSPVAVGSGPEPEEQAAPAEQAAVAEQHTPAAPPEETVASAAEPEPPSADVSAVEDGEVDAADEAGPDTDTAEPAQAVVAAASPAPAPAVEPAAAGGSARDTAWLLKQNPDYFTLQLVTLSARDRAEAFVARQQDPAEFVIYQVPREGRILHVVLYGLFSSREAAQAAADHLPPEIGRIQPWIRPVAQVQSAARLAARH